MTQHEEVTVTLQSGVEVQVYAWPGNDTAQPAVIVAPGTQPEDWDEFVSFLSPSHSPVLAELSSSLDLLHLIWEIGEPSVVIAQGQEAINVLCDVVSAAPAAVPSTVISDGMVGNDQVESVQSIATLILRGRQGTALSHESAVQMHDALEHSVLAEPESCGDFPAKDNPDAAASAVNWFLSGSINGDANACDPEPVDPKS